ncbi:MAG: hypothetical protein IJ334_13300 [Clostridia bacterium]|nr:hypothetical protein [Clostridia bacterium]
MHEESNEKKVHLKYFGIPKILPYLKPYRLTMVIMILLAAGGSLIDIVFPKYQEYAINHYIAGETLDTIVTFTVTYALLLLVKVAMDTLSTYLSTRV